MGVGENGSAEDADVLVEYLYADRPRLVKNALKALSTLRVVKIGKVYLADVYWKHLNASDTSVAKAAYQAICKSDISYGADRLYQALAGCTDDNTRKYLVRLLVKEPSWERLPYLCFSMNPEAGRPKRCRYAGRSASEASMPGLPENGRILSWRRWSREKTRFPMGSEKRLYLIWSI